MSCSRVQNKLMLYQARELPEHQHEQIRSHLRSCACCRAVAAEMRELERIAGYAVSTAVCAPASLDARVMAAIREPAPLVTRCMPGLPLAWRLRRLAFVALALLFATAAFAIAHWYAYRDVNEFMASSPAPACGPGMVPSMHALPRVNGKVVPPTSPQFRKLQKGPDGLAVYGHMRKDGVYCRCWERQADPSH